LELVHLDSEGFAAGERAVGVANELKFDGRRELNVPPQDISDVVRELQNWGADTAFRTSNARSRATAMDLAPKNRACAMVKSPKEGMNRGSAKPEDQPIPKEDFFPRVHMIFMIGWPKVRW